MSVKQINKVFCIGLNKTGTSSLHYAFKYLGIASVHFKCEKGNVKNIIEDNHKRNVKLLDGIDEFDAYSDWNYPHTNYLFRVLDQQYPNSKFILNTRDQEDWLRSREKHVQRKANLDELQEKYPESPWYQIDKDAWRSEWQELHDSVLAHFQDRAQDLLVMNVPGGDGWEKLCPFLGVPVPDQPFPRENVARGSVENRDGAIKWILSKGRRLIEKLLDR